MDGTPQLRYTTTPILMTCFIGLVIGIILAWDATPQSRKYIIGGGATVGYFVGWWLAGWILARAERWQFYEYNNSAASLPAMEQTNPGRPVVLSLILEDGSSKEIRGLTEEEWTQLGQGVRVDNGYSTRILIHIFGAGRGGTIYEIITDVLKDQRVKVLRDKGSGVEVTEKGWRFFAHLERGEYEILNMLPASPPFTRVDA